jgi:Spy/CpxP family protein refolding chaperone
MSHGLGSEGRRTRRLRKGRRTHGRGWGAALWMVGAWAVVAAQRTRPGPGGGGGPDREVLEQRVRAQMGRMMRQRLGLDEEQADRLAEVVQDFESRRRELLRLEQATRRRVEALILEGGEDEAEGRALIERMSELRVEEAELFGEEQEALLDVLTPVQVLELQALRQELGQRIRSLRGGRGGRPGAARPMRPGAFRGGAGDFGRGQLPTRSVRPA